MSKWQRRRRVCTRDGPSVSSSSQQLKENREVVVRLCILMSIRLPLGSLSTIPRCALVRHAAYYLKPFGVGVSVVVVLHVAHEQLAFGVLKIEER